MQGVSSFKEDFGKRLREQIPELQKVSIAFDADYARNPNVARALDRMTETLSQAGLQIETLKWEESEGKGLDDYLKTRLTEHFYHIEGEERDSIQQEVLRDVGCDATATLHSLISIGGTDSLPSYGQRADDVRRDLGISR